MVVVTGRNDLDYFVPWEGKYRDVGGIAGHEVSIEDSQDAFVRDNEKVVLLTLELKYYGFKAYSKIVIGLFESNS